MDGNNCQKSMKNSTKIRRKSSTDLEMDKLAILIEKKYNIYFDSYLEFHEWSIKNYRDFWKELWHYFEIIFHKPYDEILVKTGDGILDNEWFSGALFNIAENVLRIRDNRVALICVDESGSEEIITFAQLFEQVQLYTSAFRKNGLSKGDRVACYMSNRKEAVFAYLASASIGAMFGGPLPFYGVEVASNLIQIIEPKFLISVDRVIFGGEHFDLLSNLVKISEIESLEKVIIVNTQKRDAINVDSYKIRNSILLEKFLECGRDQENGVIPELAFEPLPAMHPVSIGFTSGTTGFPKGPVHPAITFLPLLRDIMFHLNLNSSDTIYIAAVPGRIIWHLFLPGLALGLKVLLFCGSPTARDCNMWNVIGRHKVTLACLVPRHLDVLEKNKITPEPGTDLTLFKGIIYGSTALRRKTYEFLRKDVKENMFVGSWYGSSELHGAFTAFYFNSPLYFGENQVPALGVDFRCCDSGGCEVIGERGESAIATPTPSFPLYLWKDVENARLKSVYLSRYNGMWSIGDVCGINPKTRGTIVIGRSDDEIKQYGERLTANDLYTAIEGIPEIEDFACIQQDNTEGQSRAVLFLKLESRTALDNRLRDIILSKIASNVSVVPEVIIQVLDIPYNVNGKRMESLIRTLVITNQVPEVTNVKNPQCLIHYCHIPELANFNK